MGWRSLDLIGQQEPRDRALEVPENGRSLGTPGWKKKKICIWLRNPRRGGGQGRKQGHLVGSGQGEPSRCGGQLLKSRVSRHSWEGCESPQTFLHPSLPSLVYRHPRQEAHGTGCDSWPVASIYGIRELGRWTQSSSPSIKSAMLST